MPPQAVDRKIKPQRKKRKPRPRLTDMPGLTVDTSSPKSQAHSHSQHSRGNSSSQSYSRSTSPGHPPYSPITPTTDSGPQLGHNVPPRQTYTHSQPPQTAIPQPAPVPITFDENTDAIALKSAISVLQMQKRNAENDMKKLARMKERAMGNPQAFARSLAAGEVKTREDPIFDPSADDSDEEDDDDEEMKDADGPAESVAEPSRSHSQGAQIMSAFGKSSSDLSLRPRETAAQTFGALGESSSGPSTRPQDASPQNASPQNASPQMFGAFAGPLSGSFSPDGIGGAKFTMNGDGRVDPPEQEIKAEDWGQLPKPQNVIRCPPINWNKYAVVGDSLDKLHADQQKRPTEGRPQIVGANGQLHFGGDAPRRTIDGVAAPYNMKDKFEKMGTRKGGKR